MKKIFLFLITIILLIGCSDNGKGKLINYEEPIVLYKFKSYTRFGGETYYFKIHQNGILYTVNVSNGFFNKYSERDTIHGYCLVPIND